jgi:hypothetical protein
MNTDSTVEERIASKAVAALYAKSGLRLELVDKNSVLGTGLWPDMRFRIAESDLELVCEIKTGLCTNMLEHTVKLLRTAVEGRPPMIMANYIDSKLAKALRQLGVNYADASGNAYINLAPYFVFIEGQIIADGLSQTRPPKPFSATDLQVIYALLTNHGLLNQNYRQVSERANVALGICGSVFRELKDQGYFVESVTTKKRQWRAKHKLIGRWVEQYPMLLKRAFVGEFSSTNLDWMRADGMNEFDAQFGGKVAVAKYVHTDVGGELSVYVNDQQQWQFIREMGLVKEPQNTNCSAVSKVKVFSKFWGRDSVSDEVDQASLTSRVVHPLMAYAELIQRGDDLSRNTANQIASKYFV